MTTPITGGCMCGEIRYECSAEPLFMFNCHCRDCQRATSSAYLPSLFFPVTAFSLVKGAAKYHSVDSDTGNIVSRGFCAECGSYVCGKNSAFLDIVGVSAANLDDPGRFQPAMDVFVSSAQAWDHMNPNLPKIAKMPSF